MRTFLSNNPCPYESALALLKDRPELRKVDSFRVVVLGGGDFTVTANLDSNNHPCPLVLQKDGSWRGQHEGFTS